jgi:protein-disulfide isomerase
MSTKSKKSKPIIEVEEEDEVIESPDEYVTFKISYFYAALVVLAFGIGSLVGYVAGGRNAKTTIIQQPVAAAAPTAAPQPAPKPVIYDIETEGFPSLGPADAPITIVEFSDYQCPFCYKWRTQVYTQLIKEYPDKIRFVYRNFPLSFHQNAFIAAEASLCAGDQNQYWEYHDVLFENFETLNDQNGRVLEQAEYNKFAESLSLDIPAFESCMTSRKYKEFIEKDMEYSASLPPDYASGEPEAAVGGTPTFFINGNRLGGAYPFEYFKAIIDAELANN